MRNLLATVGLLAALPSAAYAANVLINNGLNCSNPGNVISDSTYQNDTVYVRNVGCGTPGSPGALCPEPGAPTEVCVVAGGSVTNMYPHDSSTVTMTGGTVTSGLVAQDLSAITMNGGVVKDLGANESSTVTLNGGTVDRVIAIDSSAVTMNGGRVPTSGLQARNFSTITMNGGDAYDLSAYESSTITVVGCCFEVDGSPVPFGNLTAQTGTLTGRLSLSVHPISSPFYQGGGGYTGTITLVYGPTIPAMPEWGYVALAGSLIVIGAAVMWRRAA